VRSMTLDAQVLVVALLALLLGLIVDCTKRELSKRATYNIGVT
jgi:hypothetical protein